MSCHSTQWPGGGGAVCESMKRVKTKAGCQAAWCPSYESYDDRGNPSLVIQQIKLKKVIEWKPLYSEEFRVIYGIIQRKPFNVT